MTGAALRHSARRGAADGFALFIVLWFLVLLAAIGTFILARARTETALARNIMAAAHAETLADAGVAQAIFNQANSDPSKHWALDGTTYHVVLAGGSLALRLIDENEKINPNRAAPALMSALFQVVGSQPPQAAQVAAAIADWTHPIPKGATMTPTGNDPYQAAGLNYGSPHRPLESLDELRLVIGMTPALFAAASPYLTIFGDADAPDPQNASPVIQQVLVLANTPPASAPVTDNASSINSNAAAPAPAMNGDSGASDAGATATSAATANPAQPAATPPVIAIDVTATSSDGGVFERHAVVRIDSDDPKGYEVLDWERGALAP